MTRDRGPGRELGDCADRSAGDPAERSGDHRSDRRVEIIASSLADAQCALLGGADRIELVSALAEGGLTPSDGLIRSVLSLEIDHAVMVRPSSVSFQYRTDEIAVMRADLERMAEIGVRRVVLGILGPDGLPDVRAMNGLLRGLPMAVTFHRAIDESSDLAVSLDRLRDCPSVTHVLTSGGRGKAADNLRTIAAMIDRTNLRIIVGSGVTPENISAVRSALGDRLYDVHLGTAVRGFSVSGAVSAVLVRGAVRALGSKT